ncbi:MAG: hypothetical protein JRJ86_13480 [Deltaproteobacteria bacterium]|nr:hypothetical protein [Deltaproteobacteria bacterium]
MLFRFNSGKERSRRERQSQGRVRAESGQSQKKRTAESIRSKVLRSLEKEPLSKSEIANTIGIKQITGQLNRVVRSLIEEGIVCYTIPGKPNSRLQKYRLKGK